MTKLFLYYNNYYQKTKKYSKIIEKSLPIKKKKAGNQNNNPNGLSSIPKSNSFFSF